MVRTRLVICAAAVILVGALAGTARSAIGAPANLHAFLLRADEPARTSFSRTPAFAWAPVPGAIHYEFQLSLSTTFRDNSVVYADANLPTPVIAPDLTLPWITGNPHSLYARVRAVTTTGVTPWSDAYGFDMVPPAPPTPLPSYPGLLRWTPVEGAGAYQVWFVDAKKMETVFSNVLDEREFFTFHETQSWTGSVRWRIRVLRIDSSSSGRLNTIPAAKYGPWSPTYSSTNPAFAGGPLKLVGTVSDVFSDGSPTAPAHRLMPAFVFTGNTGLSGAPSELFRVEVFTDRQCLNRVFTGAVTGAPAYAPRPFGPLSLPASAAAIVSARTSFLPDGAEPAGITIDGDSLATTESAPDAAPTGTAPGAPGEGTGSSVGGAAPSSGSASSSSSNGPAGGGGGTITWSGRPGAPVDLWDVDWPTSGYYWTVIPVSATPPDAISTALIAPGAKTDDTVVPVAASNGFNVGDTVQIGAGPSAETKTIAGVADGQLTLASKLAFIHGAGEPVTRLGGNLQYHDLELAQDACASGRVARFGKSSEPSLTASGELFATGLSSSGRLTSALHTTAFYGQPLVSWTPALGALAYEVQWSKTRYPFAAEPVPGSGTKGYMTTGTSLVLPVGPGTWYYRVRGFDFSLPTGSQQMSWSDPAKLVVAKPTFKVVHVGKAPKTKAKPAAKTPAGTRRLSGDGFTIALPSSWRKVSVQDSTITFVYQDPVVRGGRHASLNVVKSSGRAGRSTEQWRTDLAAEFERATGLKPATAIVTLPAGSAVRLSASSGGKPPVRVVQYVVDAGSAAYVVTTGAGASSYARYAATFANALASFATR